MIQEDIKSNLAENLLAELQRIKKELSDSKKENNLLKYILNEMPTDVFVKDPSNEFRYIYCNQPFIETQGSGKPVVGKHDYEIFADADDAARLRADDIKVLKTGEYHNYEESYLNAEGNVRSIMAMKKPIKLPDYSESLLLGVTLDFSKIPQVDKMLIDARIQAEESNKMKSVFLSNMSHEVRTPLNAIVGFTELLNDPSFEMSEEDRKDALRLVRSNTDLLISIINDILDVSKLEAGTMQVNKTEFSLSVLMEDIYRLYLPRFKDLDIEFIYEKNPVSVVMFRDRTKLLQIIYNYLNNAIKYTERGSIVYGYELRPDNMVYIFVRDTGIGISEENQKIVFDRFEKLGSFVNGTGLGLAIVKGLCEYMGGSCGVKSELGKGSCFWVEIPQK